MKTESILTTCIVLILVLGGQAKPGSPADTQPSTSPGSRPASDEIAALRAEIARLTAELRALRAKLGAQQRESQSLREQLAKAKGPAYAPQDPNAMTFRTTTGKLQDDIRLGMTGAFPYGVEVLSVLSGDKMVVMTNLQTVGSSRDARGRSRPIYGSGEYRTLCISGVDTGGLAEGMRVQLLGDFSVVGTFTWEPLGSDPMRLLLLAGQGQVSYKVLQTRSPEDRRAPAIER